MQWITVAIKTQRPDHVLNTLGIRGMSINLKRAAETPSKRLPKNRLRGHYPVVDMISAHWQREKSQLREVVTRIMMGSRDGCFDARS
jgi:hypothetical protein